MQKLYFKSVLLVLIFVSFKSFAQQDAMFSQYMFNGLAINPAYAGSSESLSATALYRKQWINIEGAPTTQTIAMDMPFFNKKVGLGLNIINDKIGVVRNTAANMMYSYSIIFGKGTLAMGLQAGVDDYLADYNSVATSRQNTYDDSFSNLKRMMFNWGGGLYYYSEKFYVGASVPHIINNKLTKASGNNTDLNSKQYRHYFFTTGYVFTINENFKTKPSVLLKFVEGAPLQADFNNNIWYKERFGLGFSYRTSDSFSTLLQFQATKNFRFGYAYDFILTKLGKYSAGSHEIMLRYEIKAKNTKVISPRFF